jgi:hypothetical protein
LRPFPNPSEVSGLEEPRRIGRVCDPALEAG